MASPARTQRAEVRGNYFQKRNVRFSPPYSTSPLTPTSPSVTNSLSPSANGATPVLPPLSPQSFSTIFLMNGCAPPSSALPSASPPGFCAPSSLPILASLLTLKRSASLSPLPSAKALPILLLPSLPRLLRPTINTSNPGNSEPSAAFSTVWSAKNSRSQPPRAAKTTPCGAATSSLSGPKSSPRIQPPKTPCANPPSACSAAAPIISLPSSTCSLVCS